MAKNVKKFVNRSFARTVDLDLLKRLISPYQAAIELDWDGLPADESERRESIFEFFQRTDDGFPSDLLDALHKIMVLSNEQAADLLKEQADLVGVAIVPDDEVTADGGGRHLSPRHLALKAYLDHRPVFDRTIDVFAYRSVRSPPEYSGKHEGVASRHEDGAAREAFRDSASDFFSKRYLGRYCDVRWYREEDDVYLLILHGKHALTANVEEDGAEHSLTYREIAQDTIRYHAPSGRVWINASAAVERAKLLELFAEHMIGDKEFFDGAGADRIYTLDPIRNKGRQFRFEHAWDPDVRSVVVREIQVDQEEARANGKTRYSPWAMTVRDSRDAIARLHELAPDMELGELRIAHVKLEFCFAGESRDHRVNVKVKPPNIASFRNHAFERQILEHLRRNGIRLPSRTVSAAAAAD